MTGQSFPGLWLAVFVGLVVAACAAPDGENAGTPSTRDTSPTVSSSTTVADPATDEELRGRLYGLALVRLVTVDNTFGEGFRFTEVLVQTSTDPGAGEPERPGARRALTEAERAGIEQALATVAENRWIDDPDQWRTSDLMPVVEGSAIVGVGEIRFHDGDALVPVSLWCGGLCGLWATYRLTRTDEGWKVDGFEGPFAIS